MTPRKIRMTSVGLVAMPADRDERTIEPEDVHPDSDEAGPEHDAPEDPDRCWAWRDSGE